MEKQLELLRKQVTEGNHATVLTDSSQWQWLQDWIDEQILVLTKQLTSDDFVNDHNGYLRVVGTIRGLQSILNKLDTARREGARAQEMIKETEANA